MGFLLRSFSCFFQEFASRFEVEYFEVSAKLNVNVEEAFFRLATLIKMRMDNE